MRLIAALLCLLATHLVFAMEPAEEDVQEINPRYMLMNPQGRAVSNEDFPGRFQLISFGYTFCPDVCPTTLAAMTQVLKHLGDKAADLQPIFVTVDPERDTREVLRTYTAYFDPRILGLTGSPGLIKAVAAHYKVTYRKYVTPGAAPENYSVDHSAGMTLLGRDGQFAAKFAHGTAPQAIAARIEELMMADPKRR